MTSGSSPSNSSVGCASEPEAGKGEVGATFFERAVVPEL
jgi:hypothetical protein